jgi:hypothetical protein
MIGGGKRDQGDGGRAVDRRGTDTKIADKARALPRNGRLSDAKRAGEIIYVGKARRLKPGFQLFLSICPRICQGL